MLGTQCQLWPIKSFSGKNLFWYSWKNPLKDLWRSSFLVRLQARSLLLYKKWAQSQLFLKNFAWNFQNTFFTEYSGVVASWNYIVSIVLQGYSKTLIHIWICFHYSKLWRFYNIRNKTLKAQSRNELIQTNI